MLRTATRSGFRDLDDQGRHDSVTFRDFRGTGQEMVLRVCAGSAALLVMLLFGCSPAGPDPSDAVGPGGSDAGTDDVEAPPPGPAPCDAEVVSAIDATIAGQLAAFAADDFEAAIGFASRSFRARVDVTSFRGLILEAYPDLVDAAEHRSGACLVIDDGIAQVRVEVTGDGGARDDHLYRMVEEGDRWLVDGAITPEGADRTIT